MALVHVDMGKVLARQTAAEVNESVLGAMSETSSGEEICTVKDFLEDYFERVSILQFDGGLEKREAERVAVKELSKRYRFSIRRRYTQ